MEKVEQLATKVLGWLNPDKSTGKTLMFLNALAIGFAAASNTFAAAIDKNTSAEDKKFLVPAGAVTGLANLGIYFGMTNKLVNYLEGAVADKVTQNMIENDTFTKGVETFVDNKLLKASKQKKGLFESIKNAIKKPDTTVVDKTKVLKNNLFESMKKTLKEPDGTVTKAARVLYTKNIAKGLGVVGAFIGAVVGCAIITPILRDVSAYAVQKMRERNNPALQNKPYSPYFDPTHIGPKYAKLNKQPLSMTSYMNFTHGRTRV